MSNGKDKVKIGLVSISDRASSGIYKDEGIPALKTWLQSALLNDIVFLSKLISDDREIISKNLRILSDKENCDLILTTGGTGPSPSKKKSKNL